MTAIFEALSRLFKVVLELIEEIKRQRREGISKANQEKADHAKSDPVAAFNQHFGGMLDNPNGNDAAKADQAVDPGIRK